MLSVLSVLDGEALAVAFLAASAAYFFNPVNLRTPPGSRRQSRAGQGANLARVAPTLLYVAAAMALALLVSSASPRWWVLGAAGCLSWLLLSAILRQRRALTRADVVRTEVMHLAEALLGELQAGLGIDEAFARSTSTAPCLPQLAGAQRAGQAVPVALREAAHVEGAQSLRRLAAALEVSALSGARLAEALEAMIRAVRADLSLSRQLKGELAASRATAYVVAGLPVLVLTGGRSLGGDPWSFLLMTTPGAICLGLGVVLSLTGLWVIERIGRNAALGV